MVFLHNIRSRSDRIDALNCSQRIIMDKIKLGSQIIKLTTTLVPTQKLIYILVVYLNFYVILINFK